MSSNALYPFFSPVFCLEFECEDTDATTTVSHYQKGPFLEEEKQRFSKSTEHIHHILLPVAILLFYGLVASAERRLFAPQARMPLVERKTSAKILKVGKSAA